MLEEAIQSTFGDTSFVCKLNQLEAAFKIGDMNFENDARRDDLDTFIHLSYDSTDNIFTVVNSRSGDTLKFHPDRNTGLPRNDSITIRMKFQCVPGS